MPQMQGIALPKLLVSCCSRFCAGVASLQLVSTVSERVCHDQLPGIRFRRVAFSISSIHVSWFEISGILRGLENRAISFCVCMEQNGCWARCMLEETFQVLPSFLYCSVVAGGDRFFYPAKSSQFFMASKESAFEICMLLEVEAHMHYNHASYNGLTKVFDRMCDTSERPGRLDRRCLTEAHLRWVLSCPQ